MLLMKMIVRPEILEKANVSFKLVNPDLSNFDTLLSDEYIKLTTATKKLSKPIYIGNNKKCKFRKNCKLTLVAFLQKLQERCPLKYTVSYCAVSLSLL